MPLLPAAPGRRLRHGSLVLVAVLLSLVVGAPLAVADQSPAPSQSPAPDKAGTPAQNLTHGLKPFQPDGSTPRGAFQYTLAPGQSVRDAVSLYNYAASPLTFRLLSADAYTNGDGDYSLVDSTTKATGAGAWIRFALPKDSVLRIPPRARVDVPVVIAVPPKAGPGDHYAGIVMSLPATTRDAQGNIIKVDSRVSAQVALRVSGPVKAELTIEELNGSFDGELSPVAAGAAVVTYRVRNTGNLTQGGRQTIELRGPLGWGTQTQEVELPTILPGSAVNVQVPFTDAWPLVRYSATVTVVPSAKPGDPLAPDTTASVSFWAIPWPQLAVLLVLALLAWVVWRRFRHRSARPAGGRHGAPRTPEPSEVPVP